MLVFCSVPRETFVRFRFFQNFEFLQHSHVFWLFCVQMCYTSRETFAIFVQNSKYWPDGGWPLNVIERDYGIIEEKTL